MGKMLTPAQIADKQVRRAQAAGPDYLAGVDAVTQAPGELAAAKVDKMRNGVLNAIDSGKWGNNVAAVSIETWKNKTKTKGGRNYAQGVSDAKQTIQDFHAEFQPFLQGVQAKVAAMPDNTLEDRIQRMTTNAREIAKFQRTTRRR